VGHFNFDQAIIELGPPDKQASLSDGKQVAEGISRYDTGGTMILGGGYYRSPGGVSIVQTTPRFNESKLILTFTTNRVLSAWSRN
jgi:hypothetical protein